MHQSRELVNATGCNSLTWGITGTKFNLITCLELEIPDRYALLFSTDRVKIRWGVRKFVGR